MAEDKRSHPSGGISVYPEGVDKWPYKPLTIVSGQQKPIPVERVERTLKQRILEWPENRLDELEPHVRIWREILKIDNSFSDETIMHTPVNVLNDVYEIYRSSGRLLKEFLKPSHSSEELGELARVKRYWALVNRLKNMKIWKSLLKALKNGYAFSYKDDVQREREARIIGWCEGRIVKISHFALPGRMGRKWVLGAQYRDLCPRYNEVFKQISEEIDRYAEILKKKPDRDALTKLESLVERLKTIQDYSDRILETPFETMTSIKDHYTLKIGKIQKHPLYIDVFNFTCPICLDSHTLWVVIRG